jgi:hypothetical protein
MKLGVARLCLDCDEVHDQERCPTCASEVFAFMTRWVPRSDRRLVQPSRLSPERPELDVYRQITGQETTRRKGLIVGSALGLGVLGIVGWMWRRAAAPLSNSKGALPAESAPSSHGTRSTAVDGRAANNSTAHLKVKRPAE